jgi:GWxTD domain-containing protein
MSRFFRFSLPLLVVLGLTAAPALARPVLFTVEANRLRVNDTQTLVEYYVTIDGTSVRYARTPAGFEARVALTLTVADSAGGIRKAQKFLLRSPIIADTGAARRPFRLHERIGVLNGRHTLNFMATDQVRGAGADEVRLEMPLTAGYPASKGVQIADIQLLESYQKAAKPDDFTKSGFALTGRVSTFYPQEVETLKFYTEVYHAAAALPAGSALTLRYRIRLTDSAKPVVVGEKKVQQPAAPVNVVLTQLNLGAVPSGNCELVVEAVAPDGRVLAHAEHAFQRSNPGLPVPGEAEDLVARAKATSADDLKGTFVADIDSSKLAHYLLSLRPVCTNVEAAFVQSLATSGTARQQRAYLYHFWKKQSQTDAAERWAEYRRRIDYVDHAFANPTFRAYETDQGRVYLQYGPPDQLFTERTDPQRASANSDGRPYQIWNYYKLKNVTAPSNQTNRMFVFFQRNLGDPSPRLIHSNAIGEQVDTNWRAQVGDKFSGNSRFDRNSSTGGQ